MPGCQPLDPCSLCEAIHGTNMMIPKVSRRYGVNCNTCLHEAPTAGPCSQAKLEATRQRPTPRRRECSTVAEGARPLSGAPSGSRRPALDLCRLCGTRRAQCFSRQHQQARMCPRRGYSCALCAACFSVTCWVGPSRTKWNSVSSFEISRTQWRGPTRIVPRRRAAVPDVSTSLESARLAGQGSRADCR